MHDDYGVEKKGVLSYENLSFDRRADVYVRMVIRSC